MLCRALAAASLGGILLGQSLASIATRMPFRSQGDDRAFISADSFEENQDWGLDSDPIGGDSSPVSALFQELAHPVSAAAVASPLREPDLPSSPRAPPSI